MNSILFHPFSTDRLHQDIERALDEVIEESETIKHSFKTRVSKIDLQPLQGKIENVLSLISDPLITQQEKKWFNPRVIRNIAFGCHFLAAFGEGAIRTYEATQEDRCHNEKEEKSLLIASLVLAVIAVAAHPLTFWFDHEKDRKDKLELIAESHRLQQKHHKEFVQTLKEFLEIDPQRKDPEEHLQNCMRAYNTLLQTNPRIAPNKEDFIPYCIARLPDDHSLKKYLNAINQNAAQTSRWNDVTEGVHERGQKHGSRRFRRNWKQLQTRLGVPIETLHIEGRRIHQTGSFDLIETTL